RRLVGAPRGARRRRDDHREPVPPGPDRLRRPVVLRFPAPALLRRRRAGTRGGDGPAALTHGGLRSAEGRGRRQRQEPWPPVEVGWPAPPRSPTVMACSTRVIRVALVEVRSRASTWTIGMSGLSVSASRTSSAACG